MAVWESGQTSRPASREGIRECLRSLFLSIRGAIERGLYRLTLSFYDQSTGVISRFFETILYFSLRTRSIASLLGLDAVSIPGERYL